MLKRVKGLTFMTFKSFTEKLEKYPIYNTLAHSFPMHPFSTP